MPHVTPAPGVSRPCEVCGGPVPPATPGRGVAGRRARKTCSDGCHRDRERRRKRSAPPWVALQQAAAVLLREAERMKAGR